jgi:hypothetical protein
MVDINGADGNDTGGDSGGVFVKDSGEFILLTRCADGDGFPAYQRAATFIQQLAKRRGIVLDARDRVNGPSSTGETMISSRAAQSNSPQAGPSVLRACIVSRRADQAKSRYVLHGLAQRSPECLGRRPIIDIFSRERECERTAQCRKKCSGPILAEPFPTVCATRQSAQGSRPKQS